MPIHPPIQWGLGAVSSCVNARPLKLTTHLSAMPRLCVHTAVPHSLPYAFMARTGTNLPIPFISTAKRKISKLYDVTILEEKNSHFVCISSHF